MVYTVANYIIDRLKEQKADALFGVPSVYCADLYDAAESTAGFSAIVTSSDLEAGYAADGYARIRGLAAVAVSYGVGTLSLVNAIAGAFVERSPVVVINGGPSERNISDQASTGVVYSHSMGRAHTDLDVFRPVTAFCERATTLAAVPAKIDQAISTAITRKLPVYLEIPQGVLASACAPPAGKLNLTVPAGVAAKSAKAIVQAIKAAKAPVLIVGVEVQRYGMATTMLSVIDKLKIPWATTLLERTVLLEAHPQFIGVFNGEKAPSPLKTAISGADLIVSLGAVFGSGHASIMIPQHKKTIRVWDGNIYSFGGAAEQLSFTELLAQLDKNTMMETGQPTAPQSGPYRVREQGEAAWDGDRDLVPQPPRAPSEPAPVIASAANGMTYDDLFRVVEQLVGLDPSYLTIADTFLGIYPAARIQMSGQDCFMASAIWASIGHSVAAAVGAAIAKRKRPFVICGDGGFQMTAQSLSTMARLKLNVIVLIVENGLYGYEQYLLDRRYYSDPKHDPLPFSVISRWDYLELARGMGIAQVATANNMPELKAAITAAKAQPGPAVIQAIVQSRSLPAGL
ncbi:thiamine pyrophosphate-dependent enzyme [Mesorhizobium sp.]|uniref:thiamine pyrophosphate-dependent enzyme n=1 Tax=Mesorhizobium sp. TaxID=1871066 RepID=UPI0011FD5AE9|nr:thiamine pyrophosphate-dependent enzyme [Mesorhizobium sp.]TJV18017.1 MAG: hypothetical protein E5Y07_10215 [Mesorhizobium sp.]